MVRVKILGLAGAAALLSTATLAADLPPPLPPPVYQAPVAVVTGGWYLRGDVGVGIQHFSDFPFTQLNPAFVWPASWQINQTKMGDTTFLGFGIGYAWNNWLRFDVTGDRRIAIARLVVIEGAPRVVIENHVINLAALERRICRDPRQMADIGRVKFVVARDLLGAAALVSVHDAASLRA